MLETLITVGLIGGAGYVGYRLGKGGSTIKMNPVEHREAVPADMKGRPTFGYRISDISPRFEVETFEQAETLVHELLPVLQDLYSNGQVTGQTYSYKDELAVDTHREELWMGMVESHPRQWITRHTAQFAIYQKPDSETYDQLRDELNMILDMARMVVHFPVEFASGGMWSESAPKKKRSRRNPA